MSERRSPSVFLFVVLGVVILGVVAVVLSRGGSDDEGPAPTGNVASATLTVDGDPLPPPGDGEDAAQGEPAPALRGVGFDGDPVEIEPGRRPTAIVFLAHWCPHCQQEVELMSAWLEDNEFPDGVDVFAVSTLADPTRANYPPDEWLEREGWSVPTLVDDEDSSAADAYGLQSTPFWVFIDEDGEVVERGAGTIEPDALAQRLSELAA